MDRWSQATSRDFPAGWLVHPECLQLRGPTGGRSTWGTGGKCGARALSMQLSSRQESYAVHGFQGLFRTRGRPEQSPGAGECQAKDPPWG